MTEPLLGTIFLFAGNFAPVGYSMCEGQILPINQNVALFSLLGTTYGGDGVKTFALPKLSGPIAGTNYIIALRGNFPERA